MKKMLIIAAGTLFSTAALAQMSPTPQTNNLDDSSARQYELQEPAEGNVPLDFGITNAIQDARDGNGASDQGPNKTKDLQQDENYSR